MYTSHMPLSTATSGPLRFATARIDCSDLRSSGEEMERVIDWIAGHPASSSIHVTLRSVLSGRVPRKYQALLQSFGCTVTAKVHC